MSQPRIFSDIRCENFEEFSKLMEHLEKDGYVWNGGALKPTEYDPYDRVCDPVPRDTPISISFIGSNRDRIVYSWCKDDKYDGALSFTEFMKKERSYMDIFKKSDLEDGMVVGLRNGDYCMYFQQWNTIADYSGHVPMSSYDEDLYERIDHDLDIMEVYKLDTVYSLKFSPEDSNMELVWSRTTTTEMTISEIEEKLGIKNLKVVSEKEKDNG